MKKILFLILTFCCTITVAEAKYATINIADENQIPASINATYDSAKLKDELDYLTGDRAGWAPKLKYLKGQSANLNATYVFCLTYHTLAPKGSINYTKASYDSVTNMNRIRYIIENGFDRDYTNMDDLKYDYYITQMAIWQVQDNSFDISGYTPKDNFQATVKNAIMTLANNAKNAPIDENKRVAKYVPSNSSYQIITPAVIYTIPEESTPEVPSVPTVPTTPSDYNISVNIRYKDNCTLEYVQNARMQLLNSYNKVVESWTSNGEHIIDGLEPGNYTIKDITNNVTKKIVVKDTEKTQVITMYAEEICDFEDEEKQETEQTQETEEITEETEEVVEEVTVEEESIINPQTGVIGISSLVALLGGSTGLYRYARKKGNLFKIRL